MTPTTALHCGQVRLVLAPNAAHCLWGAAMRKAYPGALLAGPPNAAARFPDQPWDALIKTPAGRLRCRPLGCGGRCVASTAPLTRWRAIN